ncbi:ABC transporter permease [Ureibacillus chungkukjangi]|uniref:FtsX-like permease family protein n=2 Tax=Ureibacillus chungkukjangi TaxID=1202712 RepID=UPI00384F0A3D|nr:ABC transporter permease [Ureibacillus chungkukjangi]HCG4536065.1 ABC transporter permease [Salmonella enterica subsp. enterica serovar Typhi str. AG3]
MTLSRLVFRSMRKNLKQYYLYFFALIFSVTLCFSFTTLQYNPSVTEALERSGTANAGFSAASYILYVIITLFVLYASQLFMKRRSKEIGLYQLIGMTKGLVVRLIALENVVLFLFAVCIGMVLGFFSSRLFAMILMKMLDIDMVIHLVFSQEAFKQSVIIFAILLVVIILQLAWMVRRVSLLSLFSATKQADERIKRFSVFQAVMGFLGLLFIAVGYYLSTILFDIKSGFLNNLFLNMILILVSTMLGTFLFFRYSVSLIMNVIRSNKKGHLKVSDVLAVTPIMHRMKGNSKSLTLITLLTGLAVGIMSLSYISFYSSGTNARQASPYDYILLNDKGTEFINQLEQEEIEYEQDSYNISSVMLNIADLVSVQLEEFTLFDGETQTTVIPLSNLQQIEPDVQLAEGEAYLTSYVNVLAEIMPLEADKEITVKAGEIELPLYIKEIREDFMLSEEVALGSPILVVTDSVFEEIQSNNIEETQFTSQIGINLIDERDKELAEELYKNLSDERTIAIGENDTYSFTLESYEELRKRNITALGLTIFVTAFLGLAFLLTTGSILYFKQMAEAEDERESYKILRKIGFSTNDILKGIYAKQAFNFGVPLVIGLLHSYFAVKSGWWLFGTELVAPLVIIMGLYIVMYAVFAILSIQYYKKVVKESL